MLKILINFSGNRNLWEFGWAYGVGWGAAIFLFGAVVLLLCDQEEEEIYYKERTIIHAENDSRWVFWISLIVDDIFCYYFTDKWLLIASYKKVH